MRSKLLISLTFIIAAFAGSVTAQTTPKTVIIDTDAFVDQASGVKRLIAAYKSVEAEFKPRRDEVNALQAKYDQLVKEIKDTQAVADPKTLQQKADQADTIKRDIDRKAQDGQADLQKRVQVLTQPIYQDLSKALQVFAKAKGYDLIFDVAKLQGAVFVVNESVDVTAAFIADYNAKNP